MKNNMKLILLLSVSVCIGFLIYLFYQRPPLYLIANDIVPVFMNQQDAMSLPKQQSWKNLKPKQEVKVLSCIDVKHYLIYEVSLDDGETGFVNEGSYVLLRNGKPAIC